MPLTTQFVGHLRQPMLILFGAVGFVLAIACANIASLLLGRGAARRREFAVRAALGASRARVIRQLLTESIVLASAGAAVGAVVAWWSLRWLMRISPGDLPGIETVALDGRVLLFTVLLSLVTGVVCGLAPALHASVGSINADLGETSGRGSDGRRTGRTRDALVALEIAVALVLLVGAGLLLRSFHSLSRVDTGIRTAQPADLRHGAHRRARAIAAIAAGILRPRAARDRRASRRRERRRGRHAADWRRRFRLRL